MKKLARFSRDLNAGLLSGKSVTASIGDALSVDYGVKGMRKGQHKAPEALPQQQAQATPRKILPPPRQFTLRGQQQENEIIQNMRRDRRPQHEVERAYGRSMPK